MSSDTPYLTAISSLCARCLPDRGQEALADARQALEEKGAAWLETWLAALPRRVGRDPLPGSVEELAGVVVDLRSWRACDLAATDLITRAELDDDGLTRLYFQGDAEERRMVIKALSFRPAGQATEQLLQEAHRTNDEVIFESAFADGDLAARALDESDFNRGILKAAFIGLDPSRLHGYSDRANPELSAMLLDFMSEREAARREVWPGSYLVAAHAPCPGLEDRILGELWHGSDAKRAVAARAAAIMGGDRLAVAARVRLERERHPDIRVSLSAI